MNLSVFLFMLLVIELNLKIYLFVCVDNLCN